MEILELMTSWWRCDMKLKHLLFACDKYAELFGVGGDPGDDISLVSEFPLTLHPKGLSDIFA